MSEETKKPAAKKAAVTAAEKPASALAGCIPESATTSTVIKRLKDNGIETVAEALANLRGVQKAFKGNDDHVREFLQACNRSNK